MTSANKGYTFLQEPVRNPIFLVGSERSGTTLLRLILNSHPQIAFHFESDFIIPPMHSNGGFPVGADLRNYQDWLRTDYTFSVSGFNIDESLTYHELIHSFLRQKVVHAGKPIIGMTVHKQFEFLPQLFPEARFIHIIRDGRDVSYSAMQMGWYGNEWAATEVWKEAIASYDILTNQVVPENILEVRFEKLTDESKSELARITEFIGVPFDDSYY